MISASLAVTVFHHPIDSIEDLIQSPYNLIVSNGSSIHKMLLTAKPGSVYHKIAHSGKLIPMKSEAIGLDYMIESTYLHLWSLCLENIFEIPKKSGSGKVSY